MAPHDPMTSPQKSALARYLVPLILLVVVIGGVAWVGQYLPRWTRTPVNPQPPVTNKKLVEFSRAIAQWSNAKQKIDTGEKEVHLYRDYEPGSKGHYDFPFKNASDEEIEVAFYASSCDCTSMQACVLSLEEWDRVNKAFADNPADPLPYAKEPVWSELLKEQEWSKLDKDAKSAKHLLLKPGDGGIVRVQWVAKAAGQSLNVAPAVAFQSVRDNNRRDGQRLEVPVKVALPVYFHPARLQVGVLSAGGKEKTEFYAWSSTRESLDLKLNASPADPLFEVQTTLLSKQECADLEANFKNDKTFLSSKINPRVVSAHRVNVTVYEARAGKQLDLGSFHRKLEVMLDNIPLRDVPGPEIVGLVHGEVGIGGADDQRKIRFRSFSAKEGASKTIELLADAKCKLETFKHDPAWLNVKLTRDPNSEDPKFTTWRLEVTVPENTPTARSFEEPDAVILRIVGPPERFVRIPIEGHVSGR